MNFFSFPPNFYLLFPTTTMSENSSDTEDRMSNALQAYHDRSRPKIAQLAREFRVPYQRLKGRVHGRVSRSARPGPNKALDKSQEQALIDWVTLLDNANASLTAQEVEATANEILSRSGSDQHVSKNWAYRFLKRLPPEFEHIIKKPMEAERMDAERLPTIIEWFHKVEGIIRDYKVGPKNIYNFDETGFQLGQGKAQRVVTRHKRAKNIPTGGIGELVTAAECIAADGWVMPPMILFAGTVHLEDWYRDQPDLPDDYIIGTSPTGWNNEVSAYSFN
jgi:Tc5 transposase DNA-binding domain